MTIRSKILLCKIIFGIGITNFFVFIGLSIYFGGDAISGTIRDGHFFLSSHGKLTEVSGMVFSYSRWHSYSVFFTHPVAILAAGIAYQLEKKLEPGREMELWLNRFKFRK